MGQKEEFDAGLNDLFVGDDAAANGDVAGEIVSGEDVLQGVDPGAPSDEPCEQTPEETVASVSEQADEEVVADGEETAAAEAEQDQEETAVGNAEATANEVEQDQGERATGEIESPAPTPAVEIDERQWVVFALADEEYGLGISAVDSVVRLQPITAVPGAPPFVEGVTNLRGTVLPVVDLHKRFGLPPQERTAEARIVVAEVGGNRVGMIVDAVLAVNPIAPGTIEPPSPLVATVDSTFITGIAKVEGERLIILLDLERVLAHT